MLVLAESTAELVRTRWERALRLGLQRDSDAYPVGTTEVDLRARRERLDEVLREERELLEPISAQLATGPLVAIVADREGVILSALSDKHVVDPLARVRLVAGARWGEESRGTNAIGTALIEGRSVAVVGGAHFETRNSEIFCYATPVRDAYGEIVAVLDVTGPLQRHDASIGVAVEAAGVALERALRTIAYGDRRSGALSAIERLVHRDSSPAMMVEASGAIRVVNAAARTALRLDGEARLSCERVFGVSFHELLRAASKRGGIRFETRSHTFRLAVDPVAGSADRTLAVLVHFEPDRPFSIVPKPTAAFPEFATILGQDPQVTSAKEMAARFAVTSLPILLLAETGTGKELFAHAIHDASDRKNKPFVAINCGALSPELIASELFGYAPGAFTGAARTGSEGRLAAAHGGTLFLDELSEMPEALQAALLRVLESGAYQRVGEAKERRAEFRLLCATSRDLPKMVSEGKFRSDLFYRIQGACVTIPPLRERNDVVWLAQQLLEQLSPSQVPSLSEDAVAFLDQHDWPGNVRELKSAMAHALALSVGASVILRQHLPRVLVTSNKREEAGPPGTKRGIVRDAIEATLRSCAGNVSEAARRLGVGRGTIYRAVKNTKVG